MEKAISILWLWYAYQNLWYIYSMTLAICAKHIALLWCKLTPCIQLDINIMAESFCQWLYTSNHYNPCMQQSKCKEVGIAVIEIFKTDSLRHGLSLQEGICPQRSSSKKHSPGWGIDLQGNVNITTALNNWYSMPYVINSLCYWWPCNHLKSLLNFFMNVTRGLTITIVLWSISVHLKLTLETW